ncbi:PaaX family transcriptional regulator [Thermomonospora cellulosilytica]|uniref:Phenylacetic acid degradation operon negative regulatory protein n=1 Tax=Thermomonospora cellulosilytica TaxID=1411118 RepID=A0A7W3MTE5_9ACTN|nr:PaaX family transcriptional regulator C-terminal domain-containing protein [Thermomonospora cellulosilytica]MBA9001555.1 phenylacetic acid degradation operon negative regulatory protein [Thermomonospora cellulosilytica]
MTSGQTGRAGQEITLPRRRHGLQPQRLLITLFGDYWFGRTEHLPSAALVELLGEFGVTPAAARAALSRLARRGVLESSRNGRRTGYGISAEAFATPTLRRGAKRILSFATGPRPWDGLWRMVIFSVPEEQRDARHAARARLRWLGFAPLYDGVWICPHDKAADAAQSLTELGIRAHTVMTARTVPDIPQGVPPINAWNLDDLRARYDAFIGAWEPVLRQARDGAVPADEALRARTELMYAWLHFPSLDPELPAELLPPDWPRARAYEIFAELYDSLGPPAETRVRRIVAAHAPELAPLVRHHAHRGP